MARQADAASGPGPEPPEGRPALPTTHALLARTRAGERSAFDALYSRIAPAIHAWSCLRIHASLRGRLDPEDVVQETWWRALDAFGTFDPAKGVFRTWIFQIAKNTLLNAFRALRVRGETGDALRPRRLAEIPEELAEVATSVSRQAARSEEARLLLEGLAELSEDDRILVACCALEGQSAPEAALVLGISSEAAKKRWARLRSRLRERLAPIAPLLEP